MTAVKYFFCIFGYRGRLRTYTKNQSVLLCGALSSKWRVCDVFETIYPGCLFCRAARRQWRAVAALAACSTARLVTTRFATSTHASSRSAGAGVTYRYRRPASLPPTYLMKRKKRATKYNERDRKHHTPGKGCNPRSRDNSGNKTHSCIL